MDNTFNEFIHVGVLLPSVEGRLKEFIKKEKFVFYAEQIYTVEVSDTTMLNRDSTVGLSHYSF